MIAAREFDAFSTNYQSGRAVVRVTTLVADLETPVSAYLKLAAGRAGNMFLLESVEGGAQRGRYSMIGLDPDIVWRATGAQSEINRRALAEPDAFVPCPGKPLEALRAAARRIAHRHFPPASPMAAGVFGYLGYEEHGAAIWSGWPAGQTGSDRRPGSGDDPPDDHGGVRRRAR